jgi:multidrug efflux pump
MRRIFPEMWIIDVAFDNTRFIRASINEVETTVIIAFILVVAIIFYILYGTGA